MSEDLARKICVVIAAHNATSTIRRAVRSALQQPETGEVVVVDDASTDRTAEVAAEEQDGSGRLAIHRLSSNQGPSAARNLALDRSKAPIWCVLDADDYFLPHRFAAMSEDFAECDFLADDINFATEHDPDRLIGRLVGVMQAPIRTLDLAQFALSNIPRAGQKRREFGYLKPLVRRRFVDATQLRYDARLRLGEDYLFYAAALAGGARFKLCNAAGYVAVERAASLSGTHATSDLAAFHAACLALSERPGLQRNERAALRRHASSVKHRLDHRVVLDVRRSRGLMPAFAALFASTSAGYILTETARAKLKL